MTFLRQSWLGHKVLLVILCLCLYLPGQASLPPFDRDEARFAQASKQMIESGDYIDIRFQDVPRHKKPVGIYWLQAASVQLTGAVDQIWAYRVPSWLGATFAVIATFSLGALLFSPVAGFAAAGLLATCLLMGVEAHLAKTDAALLATIVLAQLGLARLWMTGTLTLVQAATFWLAVGAGILIKGPLVLLALGGPMVILSLLRRSPRWLAGLRPLWGLPLCLLVVLPWLLAITLKTGGHFWQESVGQDLLAKAAGEQESHGGPPGYYLLTALLTFWPWGGLLPVIAWGAWRQRREPAVQFLLSWLVPFWLLFEFFPTKLMHYTLPVFPVLALLAGNLLTNPTIIWPVALRRVVAGLSLLVILAFALVLVLAPAVLTPQALEVLRQDPLTALQGLPWPMLALALLSLVGMGLAFMLRHSRPPLAASALAASLIALYGGAYGYQLPHLSNFWASRALAELVAPYRASCPGPVQVMGYSEPSLVFYLGRETRFVKELPAATSNGCQLALIPESARQEGNDFEILGQAGGFNYSKGRPVALYLVRQRGQTN